MPRKPVTWVGLEPSSAQIPLVTGAAFLALIVSVGAIFLWYYFNEKH